MKFTAFLLTVFCLQLSAKSFSQQLTLSADEISLKQVFTAVEQQTGYVVLYDYNLQVQDKKVNIHVKNASLEKVLQLCLKDLPYRYYIEGENIFISRKTEALKLLKNTPGNFFTLPPENTLRLHVQDANGNPLPGATVIISSTKSQQQTDRQGNIVLTDLKKDETLVISYIGYQQKQLKIDGQAFINVVLELSDNPLDEIQMMAYGTTTRRLSTGSISQVTSEDIEKQPVANVLQALQGRVPGLEVNQSSGYSSAPFLLKIRGDKSIYNSVIPSEPLYIIDGVPISALGGLNTNSGLNINQNGFSGPANGQSPLYSLNPLDIESIDVLKDADATAIYGSRAANGVILITTKKATAGVSKLNITAYTGVSTPPRKIDLLNTQQYLAMRREAFENDGITPTVDNAIDLMVWDTTRYTDWQQKLSGSSVNTDVKIDYSGGNQKTSFRIGGGYHIETTPVPKELSFNFHDYRLSSLLSLTHSSNNKRFTTTINLNFSYANSNLPGSAFAQYLIPPNAPALTDSTGKLNFAEWGGNLPGDFASFFQPYSAKTFSTIASLALNYQLTKGLNLSASVGYSGIKQDQLQVQPKSVMDPANAMWNTNSTRFGTNNSDNWIVEPHLNYNTNIGSGNLQAIAGGTIQETISEGSYLTASGYSNDALMENIGAATSVTGDNNYAQYRYQGAFVRVNYNWRSKYIINASARRDGTSRFRSGRQMGNFGAVGGAWIFSEESWVKNNFDFLSYGKLRGSYGTTGSAGVADYQYYDLWSPLGGTASVYDGRSSLLQTQAYNTDFGWQVNKKAEVALELGFLKDHLIASLAWYQERCGNQLINYPLPSYTGFSSITANWKALVINKGWEFTLSSKNIDSKNFTWSTTFNISANENKLASYPGIELSVYKDMYRVGKPLSINPRIHYIGVDPQTGIYAFEDVNGDSQITTYDVNGSNDLLMLYNTAPKFFGGIGNDLQFKGFQLSFFFEFKKQKGPYSVYNGSPGGMSNQPVAVLNRWQKEGDVTNVPRFTTMSSYDFFNFIQSDAFISDASYIRLQNLSFGYDIPQAWIKRLKISRLRLYAQGQNLLTITNYKGIDPASPSLNNLFPPRKFFTGGIQVTL